MIVAFNAQTFGIGGAQKMMAFVINAIAPYSEKVFVILTKNDVKFSFPKNVSIKIIEPYKSVNCRLINKVFELLYYSKETKKVLKDENVDVLCSFGAYFTTVGVLAVKNTKCRLLGSERRAPQVLPWFWKVISKYSYGRCNRVVFQLEGARNFYQSIPDNRVEIIPNPFVAKEEFLNGVIKRRKVICMAAARLEIEKGFDIGIRAMKLIIERHPEFTLEIYGAGNFKTMYGPLLKELNIEKYVIYKGLSNHIIRDIRDVTVFLLPSRSEGIPNMLLEAMAAGLPCVAADCPPGGPKMLLGDNEYGLLVPVDNWTRTADAVCAIIEDEELQQSLSRNAISVKERFLPEEISKLWVDCFNNVVDVTV